jgi:7-carboxy-7-deazaguanine synthase
MHTDWDALQSSIEAAAAHTRTALKVVVFDEADYAFAREVHRRFSHLAMYLQIGTEKESSYKSDASLALRVEWLLQQVARDGWFEATILPQLHVLLWGQKRGV